MGKIKGLSLFANVGVGDNYLTECLHIAVTAIRAYQSEFLFIKECGVEDV